MAALGAVAEVVRLLVELERKVSSPVGCLCSCVG